MHRLTNRRNTLEQSAKIVQSLYTWQWVGGTLSAKERAMTVHCEKPGVQATKGRYGGMIRSTAMSAASADDKR